MSGGVEIKGLDEIFKALEEAEEAEAIKKAVKANVNGLKEEMKNEAEFRGHYDSRGKFIRPTGATKRSITDEMSVDGMSGKVYPQTHYAKYLEFGTRKMGAQPFIKPAVDKQAKKFKKDLEDLV